MGLAVEAGSTAPPPPRTCAVTIANTASQDASTAGAGYVQLALDAVVILLSLFVLPIGAELLSAAGAVVLNMVLAMNHRPGRYAAG